MRLVKDEFHDILLFLKDWNNEKLINIYYFRFRGHLIIFRTLHLALVSKKLNNFMSSINARNLHDIHFIDPFNLILRLSYSLNLYYHPFI
jgi:hypothetical protein